MSTSYTPKVSKPRATEPLANQICIWNRCFSIITSRCRKKYYLEENYICHVISLKFKILFYIYLKCIKYIQIYLNISKIYKYLLLYFNTYEETKIIQICNPNIVAIIIYVQLLVMDIASCIIISHRKIGINSSNSIYWFIKWKYFANIYKWILVHVTTWEAPSPIYTNYTEMTTTGSRNLWETWKSIEK